MMQASARYRAAALASLITLLAGCSNGIDPEAAADTSKTSPTREAASRQASKAKLPNMGRRLHPAQLALLKAADAQHGLMAVALAVFSDDGSKPLFDRSIDPGIKDTKKGLANYRRLIVALDRLATAEPGYREAIKKLSAETGVGKPHACQLPPDGLRHLFAVWPPAQVCLMQTDSALAGWDFWNIPARRRAADRETIRQLTLVGSAKLDRQSRKHLVDRVYQQAKEVVKVNINSDADKTRLKSLMTSQKDFYANLLDGKLDELAPHLHRQMCEDADSSGQDYLKLADDRGETPGKILVRTGADAINSGVNLYVAVAKDALGGPLGEEIGTGLDAAKTTWEKIEQAEKGIDELKKNVPKDAKEAIRKRAVEYLSEKLGVPADLLDKSTEDIGESVQDFAQNTEFDRRVAEAGKAGFQDIINHDLKEGVKSFDIIRQATDEVSTQTQKEDWGRGTVQVGDAKDGPLDSAVVWYEEEGKQKPKLLLHPLPVVPGERLSLPDRARVEVVEISDSGEIRRVTDGPILVSADGVAMIGLQKSEEAPPEQTPTPDAVANDTPKPLPPQSDSTNRTKNRTTEDLATKELGPNCLLRIPQELPPGWWQPMHEHSAKNHDDGIPYHSSGTWNQRFYLSRDQGFVWKSGWWRDPNNRKRDFSYIWAWVMIYGPFRGESAGPIKKAYLDTWIKEPSARYLDDTHQSILLNYTQAGGSQHYIKLVFNHNDCHVWMQLSAKPGTHSGATEEIAKQFARCITRHLDEHFGRRVVDRPDFQPKKESRGPIARP